MTKRFNHRRTGKHIPASKHPGTSALAGASAAPDKVIVGPVTNHLGMPRECAFRSCPVVWIEHGNFIRGLTSEDGTESGIVHLVCARRLFGQETKLP